MPDVNNGFQGYLREIPVYTPEDWFWIVGGDESRFYSSAVRGYVDTLPEGRQFTRILNEAELWDVLRQAAPEGLPTDIAEAVVLNKMQFDFMVEYLGLADGMDAAVAAMPEATDEDRRTKIAAKVLLRSAQTFHRDHPMVAALAAALKLSDAQLDAAWLQAAQVTL